MEYTQLAFGNENNALTITIEGPPVPANFKMRFSRISAFSMVDMINELMGQRTAIDDAEVEATKVLVTKFSTPLPSTAEIANENKSVCST